MRVAPQRQLRWLRRYQAYVTPFFTDGSSTPDSLAPYHDQIMVMGGIAVLVPPVERRWEYLVFSIKQKVREILEEIEDSEEEEVHYRVAFDDGQKEEVS